jgi:hypothetical protein
MDFHPKKCNVLSITRSRNPLKHAYMLKGHQLEELDSVKYLGVDIQSTLQWNNHINCITKKANSMLGFLHRNLRSTSTETKTNAYISMVRSNLEYCATVWCPHQKDQMAKLEMTQRRAARFATNRYHNTSSVTDMLKHLEWDTLESRRSKQKMTMMFKIVNNLVAISATDYLKPSSTPTRSSHGKKFHHFAASSNNYKFSFFPHSVPLWNSLPAQVAEAPSLVSFKRELSLIH